MQRICLFISLVLACQSQALIQQPKLIEPTVRFYRSPTSQFESGEAALDTLKAKEISSRIETWYWIENAQQREWISEQNLFYLRDFLHNSPSEQTAFLTENLFALRFENGWRPADKLSPASSITINTVRSDWACGWDALGKLCVPTDKVILAIDTAEKVQDDQGKWHGVKGRKNQMIVTAEDKLIPISKIKNWEPNPSVAFVKPMPRTTDRSSITAPETRAFTRVNIVKKELRKWHQSLLPNHGNIWWQIPDPTLKVSNIILTKEELLSRQIAFESSRHDQKASDPKSNYSALVSADGIFYSKDGETWALLDQFGEANHPVAIGPRNTLVVGDQISLDEGKTFQSYLRWDQIAHESHKILNHAPKQLSLLKVKTQSPTNIEVQIDTGYKIMTFEFNTINNQIKYLRNQLKR